MNLQIKPGTLTVCVARYFQQANAFVEDQKRIHHTRIRFSYLKYGPMYHTNRALIANEGVAVVLWLQPREVQGPMWDLYMRSSDNMVEVLPGGTLDLLRVQIP